MNTTASIAPKKSIVLLITLLAWAGSLSATALDSPTTASPHKAILTKLDKALALKDVEKIKEVRLEIEAIKPRAHVEKSDRETRDAKLGLWLSSLVKIDAHHDRTFDPNDRGSANVRPLRGMGGEQQLLVAGMSPESIKDPRAREEYKRRIAANAAKIERYNQQLPLHLSREDWLRAIEEFRKDQYDDREEDIEALARITNGEIKDDRLKKEVASILAIKLKE